MNTDPNDAWMLEAPWDAVTDDLPVEQISDDPEPMQLRGEEDANRMLRRIGAADREIARIRALADAEVARVEAWATTEIAKVDRYRSWFDRSLDAWMRAQHAANERVKTVRLPAGEVKIRATPSKLIAPDSTDDPDTWRQRLTAAGIESGAVETVTVHKIRKATIKASVQPGPVVDGDNAPAGVELVDGATLHAAVDEAGAIVPEVFVVVQPKRVTASPSRIEE